MKGLLQVSAGPSEAHPAWGQPSATHGVIAQQRCGAEGLQGSSEPPVAGGEQEEPIPAARSQAGACSFSGMVSFLSGERQG